MEKHVYFIKKVAIYFAFVSVNSAVFSQKQLYISLNEAVDVLSLEAPATKIERLNYENEILRYENYLKGFLPDVSISMSPFSFNRSIVKLQQADNGLYNYVEDYSSSSSTGLSIQQKIPFTGGNLSINSSLNYLNEFSQKRHSFSTAPFAISYSQRLFGSGKIMRMEKTIEHEKNKENVQNYCLALSGIQQKILGYYMSAFIAKLGWEVALSNRNLTDSLYSLAKIKYKNSRMTELEYKQIELQVNNNKYTEENSKSKYESAVKALLTYLGIMESAEYVEIERPEFTMPVKIDLETVRYYIEKNNPSALSRSIKRLEARKNLYSTKLENKFNADINLSFGMNQYAETLIGAYSSPSRQQSVSISFSIPLSLWGINRNKAKIAENEYTSSMISIEQELEEFDNDICDKVNKYNHNVNLWFMAEHSYKLAQEQYKLAVIELAMGKSSVYELISSQQEQSSAMQKYYDAMSNVWESYFVLRSLALYDFSRKQDLIEIFLNK